MFLDFISYSGGPLPEEQLAAVPDGVPVSILWGADDPWENMQVELSETCLVHALFKFDLVESVTAWAFN